MAAKEAYAFSEEEWQAFAGPLQSELQKLGQNISQTGGLNPLFGALQDIARQL